MFKRLSILLLTIMGVLISFHIKGETKTVVSGIHTFAESSALSEGYWVKISLESTGIYQITDRELLSMGFTNPSKVGVFGFGGNLINESFSVAHIDDLPEIATYRDDANSRILFYASGLIKWQYKSKAYVHTNNHYANEACYFLYQKNDSPLRITTDSYSSNTGSEVDYFEDYYLHENDLENIGSTGREMYGESFLYTRTRDFTFSIPGIIAGQGYITVDFIANNTVASTLSGQINGLQFMESTIRSNGSDTYQFARSLSSVTTWEYEASETNRVRLTYSPNTGSPKNAYLNYIRLNVKRELKQYNNFTLFRNNDVSDYNFTYKIDNSSSDNSLLVWDVSDALSPVIKETKSDNGSLLFSGIKGNEYALVSTSKTFPSVTNKGAVANQNLHALDQVDMIIITAPKLKEQADRLAEYRRTNDGLLVEVVTAEQVYNEFSSGTPDGTAYRLLMKMFYDRSVTKGRAPSYLLLFGDGANDNRGKNSYVWKSSVLENCLLTYQSEPSLNETESYVCDDYFGFLDDTEGGKTDMYGQITLSRDVLDLGIGRFPVRTVAQAKTMVDKVIAYSDNEVIGSWKNNLCFLGDDGDNNTHMNHADSMVSIIQRQGHHEFIFNKIYLDSYKRESTASGTAYPDAKKKFFDQLNNGALLVNYSGHGSTTSITHEKLFMLSDAESITMKKLPLWVTATCDFSRFDDIDMTAGEALVLNPNGGAIAMFTTTRVVYSDGNYQINRRLVENIFDKREDGTRYCLGDIMRFSKNALGSQINKLNFILLGDPSMKLAYPEHRMEITEVNGQKASEQIQLKAMSYVTMKGRVLDLDTDETETSFTGLIYPTVYDSEDIITAVDNDNTGNPMVFKSRTKKLFTGCDSIKNGEFEFSFIVPKDISYSMETGMVNLYARAADGREGQGYFDNYILGGTSDDIITDTIGPTINALYLNSSSFRNGDVVNSTPYFFADMEDESGINATGTAIGHDITITIYGENSSVKYILNDYYSTYAGSSKRGYVQYSIPALEDGKYTLEFKVWDVFNNSSSAAVEFEVNGNAEPVIFDLRSNINPVRDDVKFLLSHNRPETNLDVTIQVFTQMGQCVWQNRISGTSEFMESFPVEWDLRTSSGQRVLPGIYIYRAYLSCDGENYATKSKKLIVVGQ